MIGAAQITEILVSHAESFEQGIRDYRNYAHKIMRSHQHLRFHLQNQAIIGISGALVLFEPFRVMLYAGTGGLNISRLIRLIQRKERNPNER